MYPDVSVARLKYEWQSLVDEVSKKPYITRDIVSKDFSEMLSHPPSKDLYSYDWGSVEYNFYQSLVFMAILDAIDGYHAFIGMLDVRQDLNVLIERTKKYDKKRCNISDEKIPCSYCDGHGKIGFTDEDGCQSWSCQVCGGSGWIPSDPAKCVGFALCLHCSSDRRTDFSERNNDRSFPDYCQMRQERVKPGTDVNWCPKFSKKETKGKAG